MIAEILQHTIPEPVRKPLGLLEELTVLVATEQAFPVLDGRRRRTFARLFSRTTPVDRARWMDADWQVQLKTTRSVVPGAAGKLARLHQHLASREDYPTLDAMRKWGHPRWVALMADIGADRSLAAAATSLLLDREELPASPATSRMYRRLGFKTTQDGRPDRLAIFPQHLRECKWRLQKLAHDVCAKVQQPSAKACAPCPLKSFCEKYRDVTRLPKGTGPTFVDLFAGGGGLSLGLTAAGFNLKLAVEKDQHAADTLYLNHPEAPNGVVDARDIEIILKDERKLKRLEGVDIVAGGPPCQPFSMARRHSKADLNDPRRFLFKSYVQVVAKIRPKVVILENVPGIQNAAGGDITTAIHAEFNTIGYEMEHRLLNAADYGVPQNRQRFFFIGLRRSRFTDPKQTLKDIFVAIDKAKQPSAVSAVEALSGIPRLLAGEGGQVVHKTSRGPMTAYGQMMTDPRSPFLFNHHTRAHNPRDLRIFDALHWGETAAQLEERAPGMIPYQLESFGDKYRKIHPKRPAPTIPAHLHRDANSFVHFDVPRGITAREAARFQSFPDNYVFLGGFGPAFIQIGNAVPPGLARVVGEAVKKALANAPQRTRRKRRSPQHRFRSRAPRTQ